MSLDPQFQDSNVDWFYSYVFQSNMNNVKYPTLNEGFLFSLEFIPDYDQNNDPNKDLIMEYIPIGIHKPHYYISPEIYSQFQKICPTINILAELVNNLLHTLLSYHHCHIPLILLLQ